jgi:hypothetical protein
MRWAVSLQCNGSCPLILESFDLKHPNREVIQQERGQKLSRAACRCNSVIAFFWHLKFKFEIKFLHPLRKMKTV